MLKRDMITHLQNVEKDAYREMQDQWNWERERRVNGQEKPAKCWLTERAEARWNMAYTLLGEMNIKDI